jgi:hypothetical protein
MNLMAPISLRQRFRESTKYSHAENGCVEAKYWTTFGYESEHF